MTFRSRLSLLGTSRRYLLCRCIVSQSPMYYCGTAPEKGKGLFAGVDNRAAIRRDCYARASTMRVRHDAISTDGIWRLFCKSCRQDLEE